MPRPVLYEIPDLAVGEHFDLHIPNNTLRRRLNRTGRAYFIKRQPDQSLRVLRLADDNTTGKLRFAALAVGEHLTVTSDHPQYRSAKQRARRASTSLRRQFDASQTQVSGPITITRRA
ncbi:hypothetical protein [Sphingomonas psychrolutea]|uniref:Uncharacterized protein n=1 Tax=Sphingomonas psychrolutea TaxID=1259676 RepID=A0ABQ1GXH3_9SPHN|nr:hypothetical protein [Sphingomonas psychrolutea]GGA51935.1 hypothetical protein GCM10011395_22860 [Sphingomonas psychrolutea]